MIATLSLKGRIDRALKIPSPEKHEQAVDEIKREQERIAKKQAEIQHRMKVLQAKANRPFAW